ncbi:MAG: DUF6580 family putative transport protein [Candidatus Rariloculaceae bacterium]
MPYFLIVLGVIARLIPHPWNFTPIGALGVFAGANCSPRIAWLVPISALLVADLVVGFYNPVTMFFVYLGFFFGPLIGRLIIAPRRSVGRIGAAVLSTSTVFFVVSNLGVWLGGYYPLTVAGLIECYVRAIPFYGVMLLGDALYATILFGGQEVITTALSRQSDNLANS